MNIGELTTQEKSVMLATAAGWITREGIAYAFRAPAGLAEYYDHLATLQHYRVDHVCPDLYDPINMALAWGILNWMNDGSWPVGAWEVFYEWWMLVGSNRPGIKCMPYEYSPAEAQVAWLDKVLEIAVKYGMVKQ